MVRVWNYWGKYIINLCKYLMTWTVFQEKLLAKQILSVPHGKEKTKLPHLPPFNPSPFSLPPSLHSYLFPVTPSFSPHYLGTNRSKIGGEHGKSRKIVGLKSVLRFFGFNVCPYVVEEKLPIWLNSPQHKKKMKSTNSLGSSGVCKTSREMRLLLGRI